LCVKPSNFKPIAQPLEERGLIERRQDENDKRSFRIYLTEKGRAESAAIDAEFSALFEENPDAAELQQQVIEGFIAFRKLASLNSQLKIIPTDPHTRKEN
jgi:DNA-binding MarR family transcriptional regulator